MQTTTKNIGTPVAIGLGSNWGHRLEFLQAAVRALGQDILLSNMRISRVMETPALLKEGAPELWNKPFLNAVLTGYTPLSAEGMLGALKRIEKMLGREDRGVWAPREIDLDLLLYGQQVIKAENLIVPHAQMLSRDFVMQPLAQIAPDWVVPETNKTVIQLAQIFASPPNWIEPRLALPVQPTQWVGILNITPDSFSMDGLANARVEQVLQAAQRLIDEGARVLDVGAESTRPHATPLSAEQEWTRLSPVWKELRALTQHYKVLLSVDTRHASTAAKCLELGVDWVNDVSGAQNPEMLGVLQQSDCMVVVMHSLTVPASHAEIWADNVDVVSSMRAWMLETVGRLGRLGIASERLILDPGIGFGKTASQCEVLLKFVNEWRLPHVPLLIGHSRKSFLGLPKDAPNELRDAATLEWSEQLALQRVEYLRVHDVAGHVQMFGALRQKAK